MLDGLEHLRLSLKPAEDAPGHPNPPPPPQFDAYDCSYSRLVLRHCHAS